MRLVRRSALVAVLLTLFASPASAHGPCGCLTPASGPAGTRVSISYPAYKVVFNPDRTDLGIGPRQLWRAHRRGLVPTVVHRRTYRYAELPLRGPVAIRVPAQAPPGRYLVAVYEGGEGGAHYTWESFTVTGPAATAPPTNAPPRMPVPAAVVLSVAALLAGFLLGRRRSPPRRRRARAGGPFGR